MNKNLFKCWAYDLIIVLGGWLIVAACLIDSYFISMILWIAYTILMIYYGTNYYKHRKPEVTVFYDKDDDRFFVESSNDADKVVNIKVKVIIDEER